MNPRVLRQPQVGRDIIRHYNYLARFAGLHTAEKFLESIESAFNLLADNPNLGTPRKFTAKGLRRARMWAVNSFREYLIFYEPIEQGILVFRVIHSKRDYTKRIGNQSDD